MRPILSAIAIIIITASTAVVASSLPTHSTRASKPGGCSTCHFTAMAGRDGNPSTYIHPVSYQPKQNHIPPAGSIQTFRYPTPGYRNGIPIIRPYKAQKSASGDVLTLTCSSCHASDIKNAPRGPHGSQYEGILTDHYIKDDNQPENSYQYALSYRCHSRSSNLANESFKFHSLHTHAPNFQFVFTMKTLLMPLLLRNSLLPCYIFFRYIIAT